MAGRRPNKEWGAYIPAGGINDSIAAWQDDRPDRIQTVASPSTLMECPRVVWLKHRQHVPVTNEMGWGKKQRLMLGRITENLIARQLREDGKLLWWWEDEFAGQSVKFGHGEGLTRLEGTPDLLIRTMSKVAISDSKTARSDSYQWLPIQQEELWADPYWLKYKLQVTAYYMLCHWNKAWFERRNLPLPELGHLFSYGLDTGIVHREVAWEPTKEDAQRVNELTVRWNTAYQSETMPGCTCEADGLVKFCPYVTEHEITKSGSKLGINCCGDDLWKPGEM